MPPVIRGDKFRSIAEAGNQPQVEGRQSAATANSVIRCSGAKTVRSPKDAAEIVLIGLKTPHVSPQLERVFPVGPRHIVGKLIVFVYLRTCPVIADLDQKSQVEGGEPFSGGGWRQAETRRP